MRRKKKPQPSYIFTSGKMYKNNTSNISWPLFTESESGVKSKTRYLNAGETFVVLECHRSENPDYNVLRLLTEQSDIMMMLVSPSDFDLFVEL